MLGIYTFLAGALGAGAFRGNECIGPWLLQWEPKEFEGTSWVKPHLVLKEGIEVKKKNL